MKWILAAGAALLLTGCAALSPEQAQQQMLNIDELLKADVITADQAGTMRELVRAMSTSSWEDYVGPTAGVLGTVLGTFGFSRAATAIKALQQRGPAKPMDPADVRELEELITEHRAAKVHNGAGA